MRTRTLLLVATTSLVVAGCASTAHTRPWLESVQARHGLPANFDVGTVVGGECRSPITDPRDGTELRLVRSSDGEGDYLPPTGRYGSDPEELFRVHCASGRPVAVVSDRN